MCVDVNAMPTFFCQINEAANVIYENVDPEANIIFGALVDPEAKSKLTWLAEYRAALVLCGFLWLFGSCFVFVVFCLAFRDRKWTVAVCI